MSGVELSRILYVDFLPIKLALTVVNCYYELTTE